MWWGDWKEGVNLEDLGVDGSIILKKNIKGIGWEGVEWIDVTYDTAQWPAVVNTVMNLWVT